MIRRLTAALLAALGVALIVVCNTSIERAAVAPVAIHKLGLPPEAVAPFREFVASLPPLQVVGAASDEDNQRKRVILDSHLLRVGGGQWPWHGPQETGDCAAQAIGGGVELDIAIRTETDSELVWRPVDRAAIYGGGRVTIGKRAIRGEGLVPSWGLQWVDQYGILWADEPGVGPYSGQRCDLWGRDGVPAEFADKAKPYAGLTYARCDSAQAVCNAINAGHPVIFGSMRWGTDRIKLVEGRNLAIDTTDWPHAQLVTGYDGTLSNGQRLFRFLNSWGPNAHSPKSAMPGDHPGGYYVTWETMESIAREGMAFALSGANGFRQRQFVPDFSVIGAADPAPVLQQKETAAMFPLSPDLQMPGTFLGFILIALVAAVWWSRGNALRGSCATIALLAMCIPTQAQDIPWGRLTEAAQATPTSPVPADPCPDWTTLTRAAQPVAAVAFVPQWSALTLAAEVAATDRPDDVVVYSDPAVPCPRCKSMEKRVGQGDAACRVAYVKQPFAQWDIPATVREMVLREGMPLVEVRRQSGRIWVYGERTLDDLKTLLNPQPPTAIGLRACSTGCVLQP